MFPGRHFRPQAPWSTRIDFLMLAERRRRGDIAAKLRYGCGLDLDGSALEAPHWRARRSARRSRHGANRLNASQPTAEKAKTARL